MISSPSFVVPVFPSRPLLLSLFLPPLYVPGGVDPVHGADALLLPRRPCLCIARNEYGAIVRQSSATKHVVARFELPFKCSSGAVDGCLGMEGGEGGKGRWKGEMGRQNGKVNVARCKSCSTPLSFLSISSRFFSVFFVSSLFCLFCSLSLSLSCFFSIYREGRSHWNRHTRCPMRPLGNYLTPPSHPCI